MTPESILNEAMKDVIQVITILHNNVEHVVYIHDIQYNNGVQVSYSTGSTLPELTALVHDAIKAQLGDDNG